MKTLLWPLAASLLALASPASAVTIFTEIEPNNSLYGAQFLNTNDRAILVIGQRRTRDADWYRIQVSEGSMLSITLRSSGPGTRDPILGLFDPDCIEVAFNDNFPGMGRDPAIFNYRALTTGSYYIAVSGRNDRDFNGGGNRGWDYNLSITRSTVPEPGEWAVIGLALAGVGGLLWRARARRLLLAEKQ